MASNAIAIFFLIDTHDSCCITYFLSIFVAVVSVLGCILLMVVLLLLLLLFFLVCVVIVGLSSVNKSILIIQSLFFEIFVIFTAMLRQSPPACHVIGYRQAEH